MSQDVATIPKEVTRQGELVVVAKKEFEKYLKWKSEIWDTLQKVRQGREEYKNGKTKTLSSSRMLR
ncbi:MAG: hypothetical protein AAB634_03390 [Patescibacteria group bacterium]